jgi:peptide chain release factor 3
VQYPPIPSFAPEHFAVCRAADSSRYKQFRRGIEQLEQEGVVQVLRSDLRGDQAPVLAAVGPMQFEVAQHRMAAEFGAPVELSFLNYSVARRTDAASAPALDRESGVEVLTRASDGALLALVAGRWRLDRLQREHPDAALDPLIAATD